MRATDSGRAGRRLAASLMSAAALVFVLTAAPPVASAGLPGCRGWRIVPAPNPGGSANLIDALALPGGTAWAVGFTAPAKGGFGTVALRNSGSGWEAVRTPNPDPSSNRLDGLAAESGDDIWAVGSRSAGTLIEHWDGTAWSVIGSPNPPNGFSVLQDVAVLSADDAWAAGSAQDVHVHVAGLIERWNGARWKIVRAPTPGPMTFLSDVSAASPNDVWAVGSYVEGGRFANLTMHSNGAEWTSVPTPSISGQLNNLAAGSQGRMWAAGYREDPPNTLIERWDGTAWHQVRSEDRPGVVDNALFGVAVDPGTGSGWPSARRPPRRASSRR